MVKSKLEDFLKLILSLTLDLILDKVLDIVLLWFWIKVHVHSSPLVPVYLHNTCDICLQVHASQSYTCRRTVLS